MREYEMDLPLISRIMGEGKALDETTRVQMESIVGHDLKEVRVHDSCQAGELVSRLGADAFTVGAKIFAPPGRLMTGTGEGEGLLAHEVTHVVQQTKPRELAVDEPGRPLRRLGVGMRRKPLDRVSDAGAGSEPASLENGTRVSERGYIQYSGDSTLSSGGMHRAEEAQAQDVEHIARETVQTAAGETTGIAEGGSEVASGITPEAVANRVYRMMRRELLLERERR
jgi:hypothetical protein